MFTWGMARLETRHVNSLHDAGDADFQEDSDGEGGDSSSSSSSSSNGRVPSGLGHADLLHKLIPTPLDPQHFHHELLGRYRSLPPGTNSQKYSKYCCLFTTCTRALTCENVSAYALAFAMATHPRLGHECAFAGLIGELVQRVCESAQTWPRAPASLLERSPGLVRLLGGGLVGR